MTNRIKEDVLEVLNANFKGTYKNTSGNIACGDVRLSKGMYRTPEEAEEYIKESLKRKLP